MAVALLLHLICVEPAGGPGVAGLRRRPGPVWVGWREQSADGLRERCVERLPGRRLNRLPLCRPQRLPADGVQR